MIQNAMLLLLAQIGWLFRLSVHRVGGENTFPFVASGFLIGVPFLTYLVLSEFSEFEFNPKTFDCFLILFNNRWALVIWTAATNLFTIGFLGWVFSSISAFYLSHPEKMVKLAAG